MGEEGRELVPSGDPKYQICCNIAAQGERKVLTEFQP